MIQEKGFQKIKSLQVKFNIYFNAKSKYKNNSYFNKSYVNIEGKDKTYSKLNFNKN